MSNYSRKELQELVKEKLRKILNRIDPKTAKAFNVSTTKDELINAILTAQRAQSKGSDSMAQKNNGGSDRRSLKALQDAQQAAIAAQLGAEKARADAEGVLRDIEQATTEMGIHAKTTETHVATTGEHVRATEASASATKACAEGVTKMFADVKAAVTSIETVKAGAGDILTQVTKVAHDIGGKLDEASRLVDKAEKSKEDVARSATSAAASAAEAATSATKTPRNHQLALGLSSAAIICIFGLLGLLWWAGAFGARNGGNAIVPPTTPGGQTTTAQVPVVNDELEKAKKDLEEFKAREKYFLSLGPMQQVQPATPAPPVQTSAKAKAKVSVGPNGVDINAETDGPAIIFGIQNGGNTVDQVARQGVEELRRTKADKTQVDELSVRVAAIEKELSCMRSRAQNVHVPCNRRACDLIARLNRLEADIRTKADTAAICELKRLVDEALREARKPSTTCTCSQPKKFRLYSQCEHGRQVWYATPVN